MSTRKIKELVEKKYKSFKKRFILISTAALFFIFMLVVIFPAGRVKADTTYCGTANGKTTSAKPTSSLCLPSADSSAVTLSTADNTWKWSCSVYDGGGYGGSATLIATSSCSAPAGTTTSSTTSTTSSAAATKINGQCGSAQGTTTNSAPTTGLCAVGTVGSDNPAETFWTWTCVGSNGGMTLHCAAFKGTPTSSSSSTTSTTILNSTTSTTTPLSLAISCKNGYQDGTETGLDCGGSCPACATCTDTDGGQSRCTTGTVTVTGGNNAGTFTDYCEGNVQVEYFCSSDYRGIIQSNLARTDCTQWAGYICSGGSCVVGKSTTPATNLVPATQVPVTTTTTTTKPTIITTTTTAAGTASTTTTTAAGTASTTTRPTTTTTTAAGTASTTTTTASGTASTTTRPTTTTTTAAGFNSPNPALQNPITPTPTTTNDTNTIATPPLPGVNTPSANLITILGCSGSVCKAKAGDSNLGYYCSTDYSGAKTCCETALDSYGLRNCKTSDAAGTDVGSCKLNFAGLVISCTADTTDKSSTVNSTTNKNGATTAVIPTATFYNPITGTYSRGPSSGIKLLNSSDKSNQEGCSFGAKGLTCCTIDDGGAKICNTGTQDTSIVGSATGGWGAGLSTNSANDTNLLDIYKKAPSNFSSYNEGDKNVIGNSSKFTRRGSVLFQRGERFSKNSDVALYFQKPTGKGYYDPTIVKTDENGSFDVKYRVKKPVGTYAWFAKDMKTGKISKLLTYDVQW